MNWYNSCKSKPIYILENAILFILKSLIFADKQGT